MVGMAITALFLIVGLLAPLIAPHDPYQASLRNRLQPPGTEGHLLGTDHLGRDYLSRVIYGSRVSLLVGGAVVLLSATLGSLVGLLAGFYEGRFDTIVMRWIDVQLSFPFILLAITINVILDQGLTTIIVSLVAVVWVRYARIIRGRVLEVKRQAFVESARALGMRELAIALKHVAPNVSSVIVVVSCIEVARMILAEATISFLGFGVRFPTPAWGNMLNEGRSYMETAWWLTLIPGLALSIVALGINLLGDSLRDAFDPRLRR